MMADLDGLLDRLRTLSDEQSRQQQRQTLGTGYVGPRARRLVAVVARGIVTVLATIGALVTTWVTFTPCFLWIFLGGPYIEQLRGNSRLTSALSAITAAIVGVVLNLAVWFALHVFFPTTGTVDWFAVILCIAAFAAIARYKIDIVPIIIGAGILGLLYKSLTGFG